MGPAVRTGTLRCWRHGAARGMRPAVAGVSWGEPVAPPLPTRAVKGQLDLLQHSRPCNVHNASCDLGRNMRNRPLEQAPGPPRPCDSHVWSC